MNSRSEFARRLAEHDLSHSERAVAFLWYYRQTQEYEERSTSELANDLRDEGFPKPHVTRLAEDLKRNRNTVRGKRPGTFQLDLRRLSALDKKYLPLLGIKQVEVSGSLLPPEFLAATRSYLEKLVYQINGSYDFRFYDACAVLCRRLMESLIIEVYISKGRHHEIQQGGVFLPLDKLLAYIKSDKSISLGRGTPKTMDDVKQAGDTAAHDRTYITQQIDIDDIKGRYRKMISEFIVLAGIRK